MSEDDDYREELQRRLDLVFGALSRTSFLAQIFDGEWHKTLSDQISQARPGASFQTDSALMFFELDHPLRGAPWFEKAQDLLEQGHQDKLDREDKVALAFLGMDPLRHFLPLLDERLSAFASLQFKQSEVSRKIKELRANRFKPDFRNHVFELSVLGFLSLKGVLTDIEVPLSAGGGTVDGEIRIDGRQILIEVTFTSQELLPTGSGVCAVNVKPLVDQVVHKIKKKVADGRQLALARGIPSLLFLGRNRLGADSVTARWGIQECFSDPEFSRLSGLVVSDTWKLVKTEFHAGPNAETPLSKKEIKILQEWFGTNCAMQKR
jgi:hypothetical protein